ncbi:MAG: DUF4105 domain-containing protein [Muribaculaceae bacterium]|nr:DUF4105 domain-containing protein [Muribaculaceae bacterium]
MAICNIHLHKTVIVLLAMVLVVLTGQAQTDSIAVGDSIGVSLVTFYPGDESFSIYGHSEIRVQQGTQDLYYNYGVFDFNSPGFVYRFVTGDALYYCMPIPEKYARLGMEGRRMVEQRLNLTQTQAKRVRDFLIINSLPANNTYRYRYLTDNCSTRPRDIIEMAVQDDALNYGEDGATTTYRKMMAHYGQNYAWQQFGIDIVLGSELDRPLSLREQMFVPMVLMQAVQQATLTRDGRTVPLVSAKEVMVDASEQGLVLPPTPWWCSPLMVSLAVLVLALVVSILDVRRKHATRWLDSVFFLVLALSGCIITFLVTCSQHEALWPNYNLLWLHPLALIPAVGVWIGKARHLLTGYHWANAAVMTLTLAAWPLIPQVANVAFFPLMLTSLLRSASFLLVQFRQSA